MSKISIEGAEINIQSQDENDYICLTDMVSNHEEGGKLIEKWINQKSTIDFLGVWEGLNNENFNSPELGELD